MSLSTLIDTETLARRVGGSDLVIVDCRFKLDDPSWGAHEYATRHIPGAVFADLDRDLSGPKTGANGRHPLPAPDAFAQTLGRLGINEQSAVVAYDQDSGMFASRLWWMLRWMGHTRVAVLDGGLAVWTTEGRGTATGVETRRATTFSGAPRSEMLVSATDITPLIGQIGHRLVDGRAPERFRGDIEPIDRVGGHIPGAGNHFFRENLTEDGVFRTAAELAALWRTSLRGVPPQRLVCYCGSGVAACHNLLALEHAGLKGARLYSGSWSEWSADPSRPVERGDSSNDA